MKQHLFRIQSVPDNFGLELRGSVMVYQDQALSRYKYKLVDIIEENFQAMQISGTLINL